jgi:hypothetical protein
VNTWVAVKRGHPVHIARFILETFDSLMERVALSLSKRTPLDMDNGIGTSSQFLRRDGRGHRGKSEENSSDELHVEGEWFGRVEKLATARECGALKS